MAAINYIANGMFNSTIIKKHSSLVKLMTSFPHQKYITDLVHNETKVIKSSCSNYDKEFFEWYGSL